MVITDKLVYIHMPKTGGTFITSVLLRLHESATKPNSYGPIENLEPSHATCHDIPERQRNKTILSSVRSPYDWYASQYEFGWWKRTFTYQPVSYRTPAGFAIERFLPEFKRKHPHFPDLSFREFVDLCQGAASVFNSEAGTDLGLYTHGFTRFYGRQPAQLISRLDQDLGYVTSGRHKEDLFEVRFIRTDRLNRELHEFLLQMGYSREDLEFLPGLAKIMPLGIGRREDQTWDKYFSPDLRQFIREKDRPIFEIFPEFDIR